VGEVVPHGAGHHLVGGLGLALALPHVGDEPAVDDDRVAAVERGGHVAGQPVPHLDGVPRRGALDPLAVAIAGRGARDAERGDLAALGDLAQRDVAADPAGQGDLGVVHRDASWCPAAVVPPR
jgi:hypothetical protein